MALDKQAINVNFAQGLDTKTDPKQVQLGKFLELENIVFDKGGMLTKRNGFVAKAPVPFFGGDQTNNLLCNYKGDLISVGKYFLSYVNATDQWKSSAFNENLIDVEIENTVSSATNQTQCDSVVSPNGLVCTVFIDQLDTNTTQEGLFLTVTDSVTGTVIERKTQLTSVDVIGGRCFVLGNNFIILYIEKVGANLELKYLKYNFALIDYNFGFPISPVTISNNVSVDYLPATTTYDPNPNFDGFVANNNLYFAWNSNDPGNSIKTAYFDSNLVLHSVQTMSGYKATSLSVTADTTSVIPQIYVSIHDNVTNDGYAFSYDANMNLVFAPVLLTAVTSDLKVNITSIAKNGVLTVLQENKYELPYDPLAVSHYLSQNLISSSGVSLFSNYFWQGIGLASKPFIYNDGIYFLGAYESPYQSCYFLLSISDQPSGILGRFAYQNGAGYCTKGLPSVTQIGNVFSVSYLYKDLIQPVNKNTNVPPGTQVNGIYSQLGIARVSINMFAEDISNVEIADNLHLSGGFLNSFDGNCIAENNFFLYPEFIKATWNNNPTVPPLTPSGNMAAQPDGSTNTNAYFYQVVYEWSDNNGNINRSAPSIPVSVTTTGSGLGYVQLDIPYLTLTNRFFNNPVKIVIYRWSVAQQSYYQVTSIVNPTLNIKYVFPRCFTYIDTLADADILGNNLIYTTGGVVENLSPPALKNVTLFDNRLWGISAEDNSLWFSKIVLPGTPVEMSDLFTLTIAPTIGTSGSTGKVKCIFPMDDKLIIFKDNAIYYVNGSGPDITGANSQYSEPIFVTSTVGCNNQNSIVLIPSGLMFQSNKGIWLLGRDLSTNYIGAPVEAYNGIKINSSLTIPGTNQVRFMLDSGITLMYDYFYGQWGTFTNIPSISSTLFQGLHTYINEFGQVYQETLNTYLDGSSPVQIKVKTSWVNIAGLQGFQRLYFFYLIGQYFSPHRLKVDIGYDYAPYPSQQTIITPINYSPAYGVDPTYGFGNPYGGQPALEQWQVFAQRQLCQAFQITISELYDSSYGVTAGAGLSLSGLDLVVGTKKGYVPVRRNSIG